MRKLVTFFVKYPIWANALIFTIVTFGFISYAGILKKSFFPSVAPSSLSISVVLPGASPEEMEEGITLKIEDVIRGIEGIKEVTSTSSENVASVQVVLFKGYDIDEALSEVKNAIDRISSFPVSAEKPVIFKNRPRSMAMFLGLTGEVDIRTLKIYAEQIEDALLNSGVISQVGISGYPSLEISIEVPEATLLKYSLTFDQVANAVRFNNRDISAGTIKTKKEEIIIRSRSKNKTADKIGDIILRANDNGTKLLLRDIATIKEQFADVPSELTINGDAGVSFRIEKLAEEDLEKISTFCKEYVETFNQTHQGVELVVTFDFMSMLSQRLNMLINNGMIGLALVLLALGLFMNIRLSVWVAAGIPISFAGMFALGALLGITVNMISLFGMILVVGILVDDGIVIAENIYSHLERGETPLKASVEGTMEVVPAVFTSVCTTMLAFSVLFFLESFEFLKEMGIVVVLCLAISLVEAFFILPAHLAHRKFAKKNDNGRPTLRKYLNQSVDYLRFELYGKALSHILKNRFVYFVIPFAFTALVVGAVQGGLIKTVFFPSIPFDQFQVDIAFKAGAREDLVKEYLGRFETAIWAVNDQLKEEFKEQDPSGDDFIGFTFASIGGTSDGSESGRHAGNITVMMKNMDDRKFISSFDIANRVRKKIGDIPEAEKFQVAGRNRFGKAVSISLLSEDPEALNTVKELLKKSLVEFEELKDISDNLKAGRRELQMELLPEAYFLGLTHNDITRQIRQGFFGEEVQRLQKGSDEVRVWVRYPDSDRISIGQLENMKIKVQDKQYALSKLIKYETKRGIVDIKHYNGKQEIRVEAELEDPDAEVPKIIEKVKNDVLPNIIAKYPQVEFQFGGQQRQSADALNSMMIVLPIILFLITLLITLAFRSLPQALLVMSLIPIGILCAMVGHGIEGRPVSLLSLWGILALAGIIINDAVVFLDKFNRCMKEGMTLMAAVHTAGVSRFRPILLTSITTVVGLGPIIAEKSFQAQFLVPMAISIAYGIAIGTVFILFIFPVMIMILNDIRRFLVFFIANNRYFYRSGEIPYPSAEEVEPAVREIDRLKEMEEDLVTDTEYEINLEKEDF
jgi:multidrug efflux pump subunit AcrB